MMPRPDRAIAGTIAERILSREQCEALTQRIRGLARGGGETRVQIQSWSAGELRWARNLVSLAGDRRSVEVWVTRSLRGAAGAAVTNQLDDVSIESMVRAAERSARIALTKEADLEKPAPPYEYAKPAIWADATYDRTARERGAAARTLIDAAEAQGMVSAGYIAERAETFALFPHAAPAGYVAWTDAQCSMTARDPKGTGSGWAGLTSYDLSTIDAAALAERALQKAIASRNPVALEPGRYTVILEPQAVYDLVSWIVFRGLRRADPEQYGTGPFVAGYDNALGKWRSKLGLKVVDERITISHDPADPELGVLPFETNHLEPHRAVKWIDRGVLTELWSDRPYVLRNLNDNLGFPNSLSFRMSGGTSTIDEMIQSTKRGLLVTRFSDLNLYDLSSMLMKGLTRDGLWLIENGKIAKAVKNFRFTESPLFMLNSIDTLGVPTRVFSPKAPAVVPPVKARDFSFTAMIDAV